MTINFNLTSMTIYVGNINYSLGEEEIRKIFEVIGRIDAIKIVRDKRTGKSKGFCFIEMPDKKEGMEAIKTLDGQALAGRNLRVLRAHTNKVRVPVMA
jgi:RNA recognition motif-containing protein